MSEWAAIAAAADLAFDVGTSCIVPDVSQATNLPEGHSAISTESAQRSSGGSESSAPALPEVPAFARAILEHRVQGMLASELHAVRGMWIRVWYIHLHLHIRSYLARHCQLTGPPHTWQSQVAALWRDVIVQTEEFTIVLVSPTPPRNPFEVELVHDLILYQGAGDRFLPGLVTMRPNDPAIGRAIYSGAVALPPVVNREQILESLSLTRLCQERICSTRQDRTVLATDQYYQMQEGLSYVVDVGHLRSVAAGSVSRVSASQPRPSRFHQTHIRPDHSAVLERLTQLRDSGQLTGSTANVDELDDVNCSRFPPIVSDTCERSIAGLSLRPNQADLTPVLLPIGPDAAGTCICCDHQVESLQCVESKQLHGMPPVIQVKLTDGQGSADGPSEDQVPAQLNPVPIPVGAPVQIILPAFVHDMFQDLPEMFLRDNLLERGFTIRTWYLHHQHLRRSRTYRLLHLHGPPHTWKSQIIALWFDRIIPLQAIEIDLVKPTPMRVASEQTIAFDVILSQGLNDESLAGLVQVDPPLYDRLVGRFAIAVTCPLQVSGRFIIDTIAFGQTCRDYTCSIFHRWNAIPLSHARVHQMSPGDSFLVSVTAARPRPFTAAGQAPPPAPDGASDHDQDVDMSSPGHGGQVSHSTCSGTPARGSTSLHEAPCPAPDTSQNADDLIDSEPYSPSSHEGQVALQRVNLYRLGHPVTVAFVRWTDPFRVYQDVVAALAVTPVDVLTLHTLQVTPIGQQPNEKSIIVQMRHDIALASDEQLILVDVVLHQAGTGAIAVASQYSDRRVVKVQRPLARLHLLQYAHVENYCEHMQDRCLVKVNHGLWNAQDTALRDLNHGTYVQILLPPPRDGLPTLRTIQLIEDFAQDPGVDDFANHYPNWFPAQSAQPASRPHATEGSAESAEYFAQEPTDRIGDEDQSSAPDFSRSVPDAVLGQQHPQGLPAVHDFENFRLSFEVTFRDLAETAAQAEEPALQVATWYVHHDHHPRCTRYVLVELGRDPSTWPALLCEPWRHLMQPDQPIAFREVMPNPPRLFRERHHVHVILEQALHAPCHTALFSILAEGYHYESKNQIAISVPQQLSAESALQAIELESRCRVYRCNVWSGVLQFEPRVVEPIFSGIGIFVHVHGPRFRHLLFDFGDQPFWHVSSSSAAGSSQGNPLQRRAPSSLPANYAQSVQAIEDVDQHEPHGDGLFSPHLRIAWQTHLARSAHAPYRFQVVTWFCDHVRRPRSTESRIALLPIDPEQWQVVLSQTWSDWILPGLRVSMYVVNPKPEETTPFVSHIILAQNELPECVSVLISSTLPGENAWEPAHRVVKLPQLIDHHLLIHEGGLQNMCPPLRFGLNCRSWHGVQELSDGRLFLASSGHGFLIAAIEPSQDSVVLYEDSSLSVHRLFARLSNLLTKLTLKVVHFFDSTPSREFPAVRALDSACRPAAFKLHNHHSGSTSDLHSGFEPQGHGLDINSISIGDSERQSFQFNAQASEFRPGQPALPDQPDHIQDLFQLWTTFAISWDGEPATGRVVSWFVDHRRVPAHCYQGREVVLNDNYADWEPLLKQAWLEHIDPAVSLDFHVVAPQPPHLEPSIVAHVILVQAAVETWVTSLVSIFDDRFGELPRRAAITTPEHIAIEHLLLACQYDLACLYPNQIIQCDAWYDRQAIRLGHPIPGRSGYGIVIQIHRQVAGETQVQDRPVSEQSPLASTSPSSREVLSLDDALSGQDLVPLYLIDGQLPPGLPDHLALPDPPSACEAERELSRMALHRNVYLLGTTGFAFCLPISWQPPAQHCTDVYVFFPLEGTCRDSVFLHSSPAPLSEIGQMQFLYLVGLQRSVVIKQTNPCSGLHLVQYHNNEPELESFRYPDRTATPWPVPMPCSVPKPYFNADQFRSHLPKHALSFGLDFEVLQSFFRSSTGVLCPWHSHLDLPDMIRTSLPKYDPLEGCAYDLSTFDRLVIYTDGSSRSHNRRKPPLWVTEFDVADTWAFVVLGERYSSFQQPSELVFLGWQSQHVTYEKDLSHFIGTEEIGSEFAEREALFWAAIWRLAVNLDLPTVFRSDSVTTADQSMGRSGCSDMHPTFMCLRSTMQALESVLDPGCLAVEHVRGHAGDPWNELADFLAKFEATQGHHLHRHQFDFRLVGPFLPFMWMIFDRTKSLPALTQIGFDVSPPDLPSLESGCSSSPAPKRTSKSIHLQLSLATLNVGSLFLGPDGYGGKLAYIRAQMQALSLTVLGLQETRSPAGMTTADDVIRFASGCDKGQHGVELWFNTAQRFAPRSPCVGPKHFQVLHADPRRLMVRLAHPLWDCLFLVLHGPQSGRSLQERREWWTATQTIVHQFRGQLPLYVLLDANAKTGPSQPPIVFHKDDNTSANTDFLIAFLAENELCLPSTTDVHAGPSATWTSIDGLSEHRIDYVALPQVCLDTCTYSTVLEALEPGNGVEDHRAVAVQLQWTVPMTVCPSDTASVCSYNRDAIRQSVHSLDLTDISQVSWSTDIETQVQAFNTAVQSKLASICPTGRRRPKKPFLTDAAWALRQEKLHLRRRLHVARKQCVRDSLRLVFWAWRQRPAADHVAHACQQHDAHCVTVSCSLFHLNCRYWAVARRLKSTLKSCKQAQLASTLAETTASTSAGDLLHLLKPFIGPSNPKKQKKRGLPAVLKADGSLCQTPQEATQRWTEFFCAMEGGHQLDASEYRQRWVANLSKFRTTEDFCLDVRELPNLVELEAAYRRVSVGKAIGDDRIPPELCRFFASDLARSTYPMLMKLFLHGQEAAEHKGGRLAVAWKHRGDVKDCSTHRSLLISSHVGKTLHRALRQKHHSLYTRFMQTQQLGGRPFMPVGVPLHLSRAFMRWQRRLKRPTALIFLDLTEAFYRVVRPLALGGSLSDEDIGLIAARLRLDSDALHLFHEQLSQPSAIHQAGASPHVQRFMQALHSDTWFRVGFEGPLIRTTLGSRPGDSYADVVFGLLWAQLLRQYEAALIQHEILESIPFCEIPDPYSVTELPVDFCHFLGPTWMDDLSVCIAADSNTAVEQKAGLALSLLLDLCSAAHMEPNLRKGKTEVMFSFRGSQSRAFRRKYYSDGSTFPVVCENQIAQVSVVTRYMHLGGLLHHRDVDRVEVTRRLAIAHQAFTAHRRLVFHNLNIAWSKRKEIFGSLILSKLTYGLESWTLQSQTVKMQFYAGVMRLYKRLLRIPHDSHMSDLELLSTAGLPLPDELLRCCRLRYYGTLHNCGQAAQWGLLKEDDFWICLLKDDLHWLWTQVAGTTQLGSGSLVEQQLVAHIDGALPFLQAEGPTMAPTVQRDFDAHSISLFEALYLVLLDLQPDANLLQALQREIRGSPVCWTECRATLLHFCAVFTPDEAEPLAFSHAQVVAAISTLAESDHWSFLQIPCARVAQGLDIDLPVWEQWCDELSASPPDSWATLQPLPRSLCRQKLILHAYAGRRRRGDIEWFIDALAVKHPGFILQVVSVDIIIGSTYGDIGKESTRRFWLGHIEQGHVVAFLAGPPCNAWSRARNHALEGRRGPRVIRTPSEPWGIASLSLRELQQIGIGTLLLGFAFHCMAALAMRSGTGFLEHPREPEDDELVSIWRLPILRLLLALPNMRLVHLAQGLYGAHSAKPTSLLVLGMPTLEKDLHACRVSKDLPFGLSVGRSEDGQFRTAPLKEYPPAMCYGIALAMCRDLTSSESDETILPAVLTRKCAEMRGQFFGTFIGHDG
eukprot:s1596_g13.t1